jgi:hypothetical protein
MGLLPTERETRRARIIGISLSAGLPLVCYLFTASGHGYWLDAGEFVAASINLGIAHPPGQPLTAILGRLFAMLPLGPLSFRVAVASAAMAAAAAGVLYCAVETTVRAMGEQRDWVVAPLSVGVAWFVVGSLGWWFQAVRPEVYALQAALGCLVLERAVALEAAWPTRDARPLVTAALAAGLALANHHFLALLLLPALMPITGRVFRSRGFRPIVLCATAGLLGLSVYAYLPLRAAANPFPNMGNPTDLSRLFWVISAEAFQKNVGSGVPQLMSERYADVAVQLILNLHLFIPVAAVGLYALLRTPGARRIGVVWLLALSVSAVARAWLGFVRSNPDALGYLLPAFAAIGVLFAAFVAALAGTRRRAAAGAAARLPVILALATVVLGAAQFYHFAPQASLARFTATDDVDGLTRLTLPPQAVLIAHTPGTIFSFWGARAEDDARPDVTLVPVPFLTYPGTVGRLTARHGELRELLRTHLLYGELRQNVLHGLAGRRPVFVEMDARIEPELYPALSPAGLFYEALPGGATWTDERAGARRQRERYRILYRRLGSGRDEAATRNVLMWHHFTDALYYMGFGDRESARQAVRMARKIEPRAEPLSAMDKTLSDPNGKGPIDVRPFLRAIVE